MDFKEVIKVILREQGLNKAQASEILGIAPQQFGQYVNGQNVPRFDKGMEIINKLNWRMIPSPKID